jgi:hypothetical protein
MVFGLWMLDNELWGLIVQFSKNGMSSYDTYSKEQEEID